VEGDVLLLLLLLLLLCLDNQGCCVVTPLLHGQLQGTAVWQNGMLLLLLV
jgi:hypothetical protein